MILWAYGMHFGTQIFSRAFSWSFQPGQAFAFSKLPDSFSSIASSHTVSSWASSCSLPDDIPMISHAGVRIVVRGVLGYPQEASSRVEEAKKVQAVQLGVRYFKPQMIICFSIIVLNALLPRLIILVGPWVHILRNTHMFKT